MAVRRDPRLLMGRLLVEAGFVSEVQLAKTLMNQAGHRALRWPGHTLGHHLVIEKVIRRDILETILRERDAVPGEVADVLFGRIAVRNGFISEEALEECLREQKAARDTGAQPEPIGKLLVRKGLLTEQNLQAILDRQKALIGRH
jgi:hypothetical protein